MQEYLDWHIDAANRMGKPIVLEEFGINRDEGFVQSVCHDRLSRQVLSEDLRADRAPRGGG
jgi:endo-1,4-beta-mannosidase